MIVIPDMYRGEAREMMFREAERKGEPLPYLDFDGRRWQWCSDWRLPMGCMYGNKRPRGIRSWLCRCDREFVDKSDLLDHVARTCHFGKRISLEVPNWPNEAACMICDQVFELRSQKAMVLADEPIWAMPGHKSLSGEDCSGSPDRRRWRDQVSALSRV